MLFENNGLLQLYLIVKGFQRFSIFFSDMYLGQGIKFKHVSEFDKSGSRLCICLLEVYVSLIWLKSGLNDESSFWTF